MGIRDSMVLLVVYFFVVELKNLLNSACLKFCKRFFND